MTWIKRGVIFEPRPSLEWVSTAALVPFVEELGPELCRVYFTGRDAQGRGRIGTFDMDPRSPSDSIRLREDPVLDLGPLGSFDDRGVTSPWIVERGGERFLYYAGWSAGVTVPFYFYVGLAVSRDGGRSYQRVSPSPILERSAVDPYLTGSPSVRLEQGGWRMWYVSGVRWVSGPERATHYYHIKYAESADGIRWTRTGHVALDFKNEREHSIARPQVRCEGGRYEMWYSYRGAAYRIGVAESADGLTWTRRDDRAGIDVSPSGWDSESVEYPFVFDHLGRRYMLYNGNGYGQTGIGLAEWTP